MNIYINTQNVYNFQLLAKNICAGVDEHLEVLSPWQLTGVRWSKTASFPGLGDGSGLV